MEAGEALPVVYIVLWFAGLSQEEVHESPIRRSCKWQHIEDTTSFSTGKNGCITQASGNSLYNPIESCWRHWSCIRSCSAHTIFILCVISNLSPGRGSAICLSKQPNILIPWSVDYAYLSSSWNHAMPRKRENCLWCACWWRFSDCSVSKSLK